MTRTLAALFNGYGCSMLWLIVSCIVFGYMSILEKNDLLRYAIISQEEDLLNAKTQREKNEKEERNPWEMRNSKGSESIQVRVAQSSSLLRLRPV
jgi:hypothetical protein